MKKKNLCMSLIIMSLIVSLCACNKANEAVNKETPISTSVPSEETTPEPTEIPTAVPDDSEVSGAPGNQPTGNQPTIGNNTNVIEDTESNNTVDNSTTDKDITEEVPSISDIPVAPDNSESTENETIDKSDAEKFPGEDNEPTKVPTQAPTEAPDEPTAAPTPTEKPEVTVTPTPGVTEAPVEPTKEPTEAPTATPTPGVTVTPTPTPEVTVTPEPTPTPGVTVTPTPTPGSDKDDKPATSTKVENEAGYGKGKDITLDTVNVSIPTLKEFNSFGVEDHGKGWVSTTGEGEEVLGETLHNVRWALIDKEVISNHNQAFLYTNYNIGFSYTSGSSDFYLERDPATDTYTLTINRDLKYDYLSLMQADYAAYNRDLVKVLLSVVTSDVEKAYDYIYKFWYEDASIGYSYFVDVPGLDCQVRYVEEECYANNDGSIKQYVLQFRANSIGETLTQFHQGS